MKRVLVLAISSLFIALPLHAQTLCSGDAKLSPLSGRYARKELLDKLNRTRIWAVALQDWYDTSEVSITSDNRVVQIDGWHESSDTGCVQQTANGLMVKSSDGQAKWQGPFIKYAPANTSSSSFYFQKIFKSCFKDDQGRKWEFSKTEIAIDGIRHKAELMLDTSEMPSYGNPVAVDNDKRRFWMFAPLGMESWAVYRDTWVTADDRPEKDPQDGLPWHVLNPCPTKQP